MYEKGNEMMIKKMLTRKRKAEKKAKRARKALHILGLCCAFCLGATAMGYFVYVHRNVLAAAVAGMEMPKSRHRFHCCRLRKK